MKITGIITVATITLLTAESFPANFELNDLSFFNHHQYTFQALSFSFNPFFQSSIVLRNAERVEKINPQIRYSFNGITVLADFNAERPFSDSQSFVITATSGIKTRNFGLGFSYINIPESIPHTSGMEGNTSIGLLSASGFATVEDFIKVNTTIIHPFAETVFVYIPSMGNFNHISANAGMHLSISNTTLGITSHFETVPYYGLLTISAHISTKIKTITTYLKAGINFDIHNYRHFFNYEGSETFISSLFTKAGISVEFSQDETASVSILWNEINSEVPFELKIVKKLPDSNLFSITLGKYGETLVEVSFGKSLSFHSGEFKGYENESVQPSIAGGENYETGYTSSSKFSYEKTASAFRENLNEINHIEDLSKYVYGLNYTEYGTSFLSPVAVHENGGGVCRDINGSLIPYIMTQKLGYKAFPITLMFSDVGHVITVFKAKQGGWNVMEYDYVYEFNSPTPIDAVLKLYPYAFYIALSGGKTRFNQIIDSTAIGGKEIWKNKGLE